MWLKNKNVDFPPKALKAQLYAITKQELKTTLSIQLISGYGGRDQILPSNGYLLTTVN